MKTDLLAAARSFVGVYAVIFVLRFGMSLLNGDGSYSARDIGAFALEAAKVSTTIGSFALVIIVVFIATPILLVKRARQAKSGQENN
ncbi:hypothetical protein [Phenylobacterium sp.]|uniref:hypothetical protein n=1 Tax=Phenylobacterium sp. TaxID=1871053 RepID=UPI0027336315|nr:hypothetical protein [Phenylobacterium sp.]MDP3634192.1 hypothetical protein [Phenylobacterium sp.]